MSFAIMFAFLFVLGACPASRPPVAKEPPRPAPLTLRVATSGDYPPFSDGSAEAFAPVGFSVDLAKAFARSEGLEIDWLRFRWPELMTDLADRGFDLAISGITIRPERSVAGRFSLPLTVSSALVLVPESSSFQQAVDLDRPDVILAVNAGGHLERVARRLFPQAVIEAVGRNADVLDFLARGASLGVVTDSIEAKGWQARLADLRRIGPLTQDRKAALFAPDSGALARRFDLWLLRAEASGVLAGLRARHDLPRIATADPADALLASLDERLSLMARVARAKHALDLAIEDLGREDRVLRAAWRSVEEAARSMNRPLPAEEAVMRLFRAQIDAAKWIQSQELDSASSRLPASAAERRSARIELDESLRPALIRIGDRIAMIVAWGPGPDRRTEDADPAFSLDVVPDLSPDLLEVRSALDRHALPEAHLRALHEALVSLLRSTRAGRNASGRPPEPARADTASSE